MIVSFLFLFVISAQRVHPFPFRTRKLSSAAATILGGRLPGKIAHRELQLVISAQRVHPFPFRTRKLSSVAATILGGRLPGKIVHCQHNMFLCRRFFLAVPRFYICIFLLSSVGRAGGTNYTGAIPIKADRKRSLKLYKFHIFLLSSVGRARDC